MTSSGVSLLAAACSLLILTSFIGGTQSASCCLMYAKRALPCQRLRHYYIQTINASCDINAVIFHVPGRFVCADPSASWTLRGIECLHERQRKDAAKIREESRGASSS